MLSVAANQDKVKELVVTFDALRLVAAEGEIVPARVPFFTS